MNLINQQKITKAKLSLPSIPPHYDNVVVLFDRAVAIFAERIAIKQGSRSITYQELDIKSRTLAYSLLQAGFKTGDVVALHGDRTIELFAAFIAIFRIGCVVLPINQDLPLLRKNKMLACLPYFAGVLHVTVNCATSFQSGQDFYLDSTQNYLRDFTDSLPDDFFFPVVNPDSPAYIFLLPGVRANRKLFWVFINL